MFISGFVVAKRLSGLNIPVLETLFVHHRTAFSVLVGIVTSLACAFGLYLDEKISWQSVVGFIVLLLASTTCYYVGVALGWKKASNF